MGSGAPRAVWPLWLMCFPELGLKQLLGFEHVNSATEVNKTPQFLKLSICLSAVLGWNLRNNRDHSRQFLVPSLGSHFILLLHEVVC